MLIFPRRKKKLMKIRVNLNLVKTDLNNFNQYSLFTLHPKMISFLIILLFVNFVTNQEIDPRPSCTCTNRFGIMRLSCRDDLEDLGNLNDTIKGK